MPRRRWTNPPLRPTRWTDVVGILLLGCVIGFGSMFLGCRGCSPDRWFPQPVRPWDHTGLSKPFNESLWAPMLHGMSSAPNAYLDFRQTPTVNLFVVTH
jgi:hypothetical protein